MSIISSLGKIYKKVDAKNGVMFLHSREDDESFLQKFPEPQDDIERSFYQYLCQKHNDGSGLKYFVSNFAAFFLIVPFYAKFRINSRKAENREKADSVLTMEFIKEHLPDEYKNEKCLYAEFDNGILGKEDKDFIKKIRHRHPFSFYFRFKIMCRIASYSYLLNSYNPHRIFASAEYSFTSSVLTLYCESKGAEHINIMHGDKLFNIREAFCRFHRFYIWDEHYTGLFNSLRADKTEYIVRPLSAPDISPNKEKKHCTFYLQLHTEEQLNRIKSALLKTGVEYSVRFHPIYSDEITEKVFEDSCREDNKKVDIWTSIENAGYVVSGFSTVLYQAYLAGADIVIDDISNPELFEMLAERDYIMLSKPHILLSELINKN